MRLPPVGCVRQAVVWLGGWQVPAEAEVEVKCEGYLLAVKVKFTDT